MYKKSKYVAGDDQTGCPTAMVFSEHLTHSDVARRNFSKVTSAGFVQIGIDGKTKELVVNVYGESVSLKVPSSPKDLWLVKGALGINEDY